MEQFDDLLKEISPKLPQRLWKKTSWKENLLITLLYMRQYISIKFLSWIFGIDGSTISRNMQATMSVLSSWANDMIVFPPEQTRLKNSVFFKNAQISIIVDGTEQQVAVPESKLIEQAVYSGKKKKHTFTRLLGVSPLGHIYFLSPSHPGSLNDLNLYDNYKLHQKLEKHEWVAADKGFRGCHNDHPFVLPFLQSPTAELSPKQDEFNRDFAKIRITVENTIALIKKWKICAQVFRCKFQNLDEALCNNGMYWKVCAALVNRFNLKYKK